MKSKSKHLGVEFVRYVIVGATAFIVDFTLLSVLTECAGINYLVSSVLSYIIGLIITYTLSIKWIFAVRSVANTTIELFTFILIGVVGLALSALLMWLLTDKYLCHYQISKIITTIIVFIFNFIAKKVLLFAKKI